jgi:hypothetical protein
MCGYVAPPSRRLSGGRPARRTPSLPEIIYLLYAPACERGTRSPQPARPFDSAQGRLWRYCPCAAPQEQPALLSWDDADIGQVAVLLSVVEPVAHNKFVRNLKANVIAFERKLAARWLIEQRGYF